MSRPDDELAVKIVQQLDRGIEHLDPVTRERLAAARKIALSRYRGQPEAVSGLAWAMNTISVKRWQRPHGARYLIAAAALVLALICVTYWQTMAPNDFSDIDVNLLTDDLPISAYLDRGFESWLKRAPQ
jgi:Protein of unknown function (DUF3619)